MTIFPKISLITPCYNAVAYLERAIQSVINQSYPNLEYIIVDGGSSDGSVDIIKKYEKHLTYWVSEEDEGMYHALQKGFDKSTGEIMGWLNADDLHHPGALFMLAQTFNDFKKVHWIQGTPNAIDELDRIVFAAPRPQVDKFFFYRKKHIDSRLYIQQESTFWRRTLWEAADSYISQEFHYAGDFELWIRFFKHQKLYLMPALLGAFRVSRSGQASVENYTKYVEETLKILTDAPLSRYERRRLRYLQFLEALEQRFSIVARIKRKLYGQHKTIVDNKIRFDRVTQQFKLY